MNCRELNQDIDNLQTSLDKLAKTLSEGTVSGNIKRGFKKNLQDTRTFCDEVIQKNIEDFQKKNPEAFRRTIEKVYENFLFKQSGTAIRPDGNSMISLFFGTLRDFNETTQKKYDAGGLTGIAASQNGETLFLATLGNIFTYEQVDGEWTIQEIDLKMPHSIVEHLEPFNNGVIASGYGNEAYYVHQQNQEWKLETIPTQLTEETTVCAVPNADSIVFYDRINNLEICQRNKQTNQWESKQKIDNTRHCLGKVTNCLPLPNDDGFLFSGNLDVVYCYPTDDGWEVSRIPYWGTKGEINILPFPDGKNLLISQANHNSFFHKEDDGKWVQVGCPNLHIYKNINTMIQIPNTDEFLVGGDNGTLYVIKQEDGEWIIKEKINGINAPTNYIDTPSQYEDITSIKVIPNTNTILIGTNNGNVYSYNERPIEEAIDMMLNSKEETDEDEDEL